MALNEMIETGLQRLYSTETVLLRCMEEKADQISGSPELRRVLTEQSRTARDHIRKLEQIGQMVGMMPNSNGSPLAQSLGREFDNLLMSIDRSPVADAEFIACLQTGEHMQIAGYGTMKSLLERAGVYDAAQILRTTLDDAKRADQILTIVAESRINQEAVASAGKSFA